jgi:hypothetical protein
VGERVIHIKERRKALRIVRAMLVTGRTRPAPARAHAFGERKGSLSKLRVQREKERSVASLIQKREKIKAGNGWRWPQRERGRGGARCRSLRLSFFSRPTPSHPHARPPAAPPVTMAARHARVRGVCGAGGCGAVGRVRRAGTLALLEPQTQKLQVLPPHPSGLRLPECPTDPAFSCPTPRASPAVCGERVDLLLSYPPLQ